MTKDNFLEDDMTNNWGCNYVNVFKQRTEYSRRFLERAISRDVVGYNLFSLEKNGSKANDMAIQLSTNNDYSNCLFGIGCYLAGDGSILQKYSTNAFNQTKSLTLPIDPCSVKYNEITKQAVALPYFIPTEKHDREKQINIEKECIKELHCRLLVSIFIGKPIKAIILEYILAGNGGKLSNEFLIKIGKLCQVFGIVIIADEVLTGCHVGPNATITQRMPEEFKNQVQYITMGKIFGCGIVLEKVSKVYLPLEEKERGVSSDIVPSEAYCLWDNVMGKIYEKN